jgi:hypothetical protein
MQPEPEDDEEQAAAGIREVSAKKRQETRELTRQLINQLRQSAMSANTNDVRFAQLLHQLRGKQWTVAATLLDESPELLTLGDTFALERARLADMIPHASVPVVELVLATLPRVTQQLDNANAHLAQTLANSALSGIDLYSTPLGDFSRAALARLARERQLSTLVWAGLQLGDSGAQQLVKELAAGDEPSTVTSLDLRQNDLTTLPLELLQLPALTELHFDENPGLDPTLAKILSTQGLPGLLKMLPDLHGDPKPS